MVVIRVFKGPLLLQRNRGGGADQDDQLSIVDATECKKLRLDWSYSTRKKMLLRHDPSQTTITNNYDIANQIDLLVKSKPELMNALHHGHNEFKQVCFKQTNFQSFFQQIIVNAEKMLKNYRMLGDIVL